MNPGWSMEGRVVANWRTCDWQPFPGRNELMWHPLRECSQPGHGFYLLRLAPGEIAPEHSMGVREEFIVLDGSLKDSDESILIAGDFVSYLPGTRHRAEAMNDCTLLTLITPASGQEHEPEPLAAGRKVANWKTAAFEPYPGLPKAGNPLLWHDIRGNPDTAEGFYIVNFTPGAVSAAHEHTGYEEFVILDGSLTDSDGTVYKTDDCVSLPPGSIHSSHTEEGCFTAAMISGPFRTLVDGV